MFIGNFVDIVSTSIATCLTRMRHSPSVHIRVASAAYILYIFAILAVFIARFGFTGVAAVMIVCTVYALRVRKRPVMRKPTRYPNCRVMESLATDGSGVPE
jgi:hypothetical protein